MLPPGNRLILMRLIRHLKGIAQHADKTKVVSHSLTFKYSLSLSLSLFLSEIHITHILVDGREELGDCFCAQSSALNGTAHEVSPSNSVD
jgi:hypothetical protein